MKKKSQIKIAFAGNGHGGIAAFQSLISSFERIEILSQDQEIKKLMRSNDNLIKSLEEMESNILICAGYMKIIPKSFLKRKIIINTHPSLLPKYRGIHSLAWAMLNFEEELGFTIHLINEYLDDGDILEQFKINYQMQTSSEIMKIFDNYVKNNLGRVVEDFLEKKIIPIKQDRSKASWVCKRNIEDCIIDFNENNRFISAMFRTLVEPYPLPIIKIEGNLYEILSHRLIEKKYKMHNGRVINIENNDAYIKTEEGILIINLLRDFKTKNKLFAGKILDLGKRL